VSAARRLSAFAVAAVVLAAPAAAHAQSAPPKGISAATTVVRADKRPAKAAPAQECANTELMPTAQNLELVRAAVLCLHNQIRVQLGLTRLKDNAKLRKAANGHSSSMVDEGFFAHTSPSGETFVERVLGAGYAKPTDGWMLGENLAWGTGEQSTPAGGMNAWMNSAGHKANIVKGGYREIGVGVRLGGPEDPGVGATFTAEFGAKG
jgi:uncharacterized protein YkwD